MSRSFKKTPIYKDKSKYSAKRKFWKRYVERKVRKSHIELRKSNAYRKIGERWDMYDYRIYVNKPIDAADEELRCWKKCYFRK